LLRGTLPGFLTVRVNVAVPPLVTVWLVGVLITVINGVGGAVIVTCALSESVTVGPPATVPLAVTVFMKPAVTLVVVQV
jgi:hypothetical protein